MADRRRLDEILTTLENEPELKDIITEGVTDANIINWFLAQKKINNVSVIDISDIEVDRETLETYNLLEGGNRSKVIAISALCQGRSWESQMTCLIDRDLDSLLESLPKYPSLLTTDFSNMEMYYFEEKILRKFFQLCFNKKMEDLNSFMYSISLVLIELFLIRAANEKLKWKLTSLDIDKFISFNGMDIIFDKAEYIKRYLNKNSRLPNLGLFTECIESLREKISEDYRLFMHGHDFLKLLSLYVSKALRKPDYECGIINGHYFRMELNIEDINQYSMFSKIMKKCA